jgi:hypothetical protein
MTRLRSALLVALALAAGFAIDPAAAQTIAAPPPGDDPRQRLVTIYGPGQLGTAASTATRLDRTRREMNRGRPDNTVLDPFPTDPAVIIDRAQTALNRARTGCQVVNAAVMGLSIDNAVVYEAACAAGPGYLVVASIRPEAVECGALAEGTDHSDRDVDANVVSRCMLPGNQPTLESISDYARRAGVACTIDEAVVVGRDNSGAVFEVGCRDTSGYWVTQENGEWRRIPCLKVTGMDGICRFTTVAERNGRLAAQVTDTAAAGCNVEDATYVGSSNGRDYFEARCSDGLGYMLEVGRDEQVSNAWNCANASRIAGGCRLTSAPAEG